MAESRLKKLRKGMGYTQERLCTITGIDQSDYSKIENGKRYMTINQCKMLALALNTSMDYLSELTDEATPYPINAKSKKILS